MIDLQQAYSERFRTILEPLTHAVEEHLREHLASEPRIDRVTVRAKSIDSFLQKARTMVDGSPKYTEPLRQIQDQVGARIVTFYRSDVDRLAATVEKYYRRIEARNLVPESEWEFGYFGRHYVLFLPSDVIQKATSSPQIPEFFELQIKTLFQHAWSEANHDLGYKPGSDELESDAKRKLAFTSAQAWGADHIFDELFLKHSGAANDVPRGAK